MPVMPSDVVGTVIGTEINESKAFELYKIAAEKDHIVLI